MLILLGWCVDLPVLLLTAPGRPPISSAVAGRSRCGPPGRPWSWCHLHGRGGRHPALAGPAGADLPRRAGVAPRPPGPPETWVRCRAREGASVTDSPTRCYVLDTSVLLSDPWALTRFDEHEVVLPLVVISELEGKRHHPELGWFARRPCACSTSCASSTAGWTPRSRSAPAAAPCTSSSTTPTRRCSPQGSAATPTTAASSPARSTSPRSARAAGLGDVVLVTKDMPLRVKAAAVGLAADEYHALDVVPSGWTGMADLEVDERRRRRPVPRGRHRPRRRPRAAVPTPGCGCSAAGRRRWAG